MTPVDRREWLRGAAGATVATIATTGAVGAAGGVALAQVSASPATNSAAAPAAPSPGTAPDGAATNNSDRSAQGAVLVRRFWDAFNRAAWDELDALVAPGYRHHPPGKSLTLAQFKAGGAWVHGRMSGYRLQIDSLVASDAQVAIRWTATGTHSGSFFGEAVTGKSLSVQGMHFHAISDGRIVEDWEVIDFDGLKAQVRS